MNYNAYQAWSQNSILSYRTHKYLVMHQYGILPIIWLTDITIGLLADTDNLTNVYFSQNFNELKMWLLLLLY